MLINGKVVPLIITSNFIKIEKDSLKNKCNIIKQKAFSSKEEQNRDIYYYSLCLTYSFIIDIFNKSVITEEMRNKLHEKRQYEEVNENHKEHEMDTINVKTEKIFTKHKDQSKAYNNLKLRAN